MEGIYSLYIRDPLFMDVIKILQISWVNIFFLNILIIKIIKYVIYLFNVDKKNEYFFPL